MSLGAVVVIPSADVETEVKRFALKVSTERTRVCSDSTAQLDREILKKKECHFSPPGLFQSKENLLVSGKCQWEISEWSRVCPAAFWIREVLPVFRGEGVSHTAEERQAGLTLWPG